jgi:basic membrane lipoprotein Med (substrate-binding protein (PBP1-ABC) superfamily)
MKPAGWAAAVGGVILAVVLTVLFWPSGPTTPPVRARVYTAFDACLLTDSQGVTGPAAAPVWSGMESASLATHAKVSFLSVAGPDTEGNAVPFVNTLVARHCDLILAVGSSEVKAVAAVAGAHRDTHFVVIGTSSTLSNVAAVEAATGSVTSNLVSSVVSRAVNGNFAGGSVS